MKTKRHLTAVILPCTHTRNITDNWIYFTTDLPQDGAMSSIEMLKTSTITSLTFLGIYLLYMLAIGKFVEFFNGFKSLQETTETSDGLLVLQDEAVGGSRNIAFSFIIIVAFMILSIVNALFHVISHRYRLFHNNSNNNNINNNSNSNNDAHRNIDNAGGTCAMKCHGQLVEVLTWLLFFIRRGKSMNVGQGGGDGDDGDESSENAPLYMFQLFKRALESTQLSTASNGSSSNTLALLYLGNDIKLGHDVTLSSKQIMTSFDIIDEPEE